MVFGAFTLLFRVINKIVLIAFWSAVVFFAVSWGIAHADTPYLFSDPCSRAISVVGMNGNYSGGNGYFGFYFFSSSSVNVSGNAYGTVRDLAGQASTGNATATISDLGQCGLPDGQYTVVVIGVGPTDANINNFVDGACGSGKTLTDCQNNWGYSPDSNSAASFTLSLGGTTVYINTTSTVMESSTPIEVIADHGVTALTFGLAFIVFAILFVGGIAFYSRHSKN